MLRKYNCFLCWLNIRCESRWKRWIHFEITFDLWKPLSRKVWKRPLITLRSWQWIIHHNVFNNTSQFSCLNYFVIFMRSLLYWVIYPFVCKFNRKLIFCERLHFRAHFPRIERFCKSGRLLKLEIPRTGKGIFAVIWHLNIVISGWNSTDIHYLHNVYLHFMFTLLLVQRW